MSKPTHESFSLPFHLLNDDRLNLTDRVIFSIAWRTSKRGFRTTSSYILKQTGFARKTINESLVRLEELGYIDPDFVPLSSAMHIINIDHCTSRDLKRTVGKAFCEQLATHERSPTYIANVLGTTRKTALGYRKLAANI